MKKLKNIKFELDIQGRGVVNYDGAEQKYASIKKISKANRDNVKYAKKNLYKKIDKDGKEYNSYKLKISSNSLKASIYGDNYVAHTPSIKHNTILFYRHIASDYSILRGFMNTENNESHKRSSVLNITDAEQTCNAISMIETCTSSGEKKVTKEGEVKDDDDKKDITLHAKESVGDISYRAFGNIDLDNLELISCDSIFDRLAFDEDYFDMFEKNLSLNQTTGKLSYYILSNSNGVNEVPERAFKLDEKSRLRLIKKVLKMLLDYEVYKNGAYAERKELRVKLIDNALNEDDWITVETHEDIEKLFENVELFEFYKEEKERESVELRDEMAKAMAENMKKSKSVKNKKNVSKA